MDTKSEPEGTGVTGIRDKNQRRGFTRLVAGFALLIALAGVIYGWKANANSKIANQGLVTAQAAEQSMGSQVALAESTTQAALRQQANAERAAQEARNSQATAESAAQEARNAQATAESDAQQRALVDALANQEVQAAKEEARLATSRWLAAQAMNTLEMDPQLAAHLALQAIETGSTFEAENALHQVLPELRLVKSTPITDIIPEADAKTNFITYELRENVMIVTGTPDGIEIVDLIDGTRSVLAESKDCYDVKTTSDKYWLAARCTLDGGDYWTNHAIQVWEIVAQQLLLTIPERIDYPYIYGLVPPSSTHSLLVFGQLADRSIHIWDGISGEERVILTSPVDDSWNEGLASPDGNHLATYDDKGLVELWDLDSGQKHAVFDAQSQIWQLAFSPDGNRLIAHGGGQVQMWDLDTGLRLAFFDDMQIHEMTFSPDGIHLTLLSYEKIQIWDISQDSQEPELLVEINSDNVCHYTECNILYSPDGQILANGSWNGPVQLWDAKYGTRLLTLYGHTEASRPLHFSRDGMRLYTISRDGTLKEWDITPKGALIVIPGKIGSSPYSPDGKYLAIAGDGGFASIVDSHTGEVQLSWQAHPRWTFQYADIAWSPDGSRLATYIYSDTVKIWESSNGQLIRDFASEYPIDGIAWSPDGKRIALSDGGSIIIWDTNSGKKLLNLKDVNQWLNWSGASVVHFSPDGTKIAAGNAWCPINETLALEECTYALAIWDATNGNGLFRLGPEYTDVLTQGGKITVFYRLKNPASEVGSQVYPSRKERSLTYRTFCIAFSPDGQYLAAGAPNGIILWKLKDSGAEKVQVLRSPGFNGEIYSLSFSPDGTLLASASGDGKIRVWDLDTGQVRWEVAGGVQVAFSPDGTRLVSSSYGITTIHVLPLDELTEQVRSRIIRPMTTEECRTYLHQETCQGLTD